MYQLAEYPVRGLVFECGQNLPDMADFVAEVCVRLQEGNIPHNLFIVDCGMRVFLYPNAFAAAKAEVSRCLSCINFGNDLTLRVIGLYDNCMSSAYGLYPDLSGCMVLYARQCNGYVLVCCKTC